MTSRERMVRAINNNEYIFVYNDNCDELTRLKYDEENDVFFFQNDEKVDMKGLIGQYIIIMNDKEAFYYEK